MSLRILFAAAAAAFCFAQVGSVSAQDQTPEQALPDGPGKDVVLRVCTVCHGAEQFAYARFSPEAWGFEVSKMQSAGAEMTADEQDAIIGYLSKYLAKAAPAPAAAPGSAPTATPTAPAKPPAAPPTETTPPPSPTPG